MSETCKHHLLLRDQEVRIILEALEQYDPAKSDGNSPRGESEQLARLIQRGTGIPLEFVSGTDRTPFERRST